MDFSVQHAKKLLQGLLALSGYVEDVAKWLIFLAKKAGPHKTIECSYEGVILHVHAASTVEEVRLHHERELFLSQRQPRLHQLC